MPSSISSSLSLAATPSHDNDKFSIEYNKYTLDLLNAGDELKIFDQSPIVFVDRNLNELTLTKNNLHSILESYQTFKAKSDQSMESTKMLAVADPSTVLQPEAYYDNVEIEEEMLIDEPLDPILEEIVETKANPPPGVPTVAGNKKKAAPSPFKSKFHKTEVLEKQAREKSLAMTLSAYLDVCVTNGMLNRAFQTICHYRYRHQRFAGAIQVNDINVYNILMHGYAEKGNFLKISEILQMLMEDKIQLNQQSFAAIFESLGRLEVKPDVMKKLEYYRSEAAKLVSVLK
jgi:DNA-directed RNA polymerase, mitochondrial